MTIGVWFLLLLLGIVTGVHGDGLIYLVNVYGGAALYQGEPPQSNANVCKWARIVLPGTEFLNDTEQCEMLVIACIGEFILFAALAILLHRYMLDSGRVLGCGWKSLLYMITFGVPTCFCPMDDFPDTVADDMAGAQADLINRMRMAEAGFPFTMPEIFREEFLQRVLDRSILIDFDSKLFDEKTCAMCLADFCPDDAAIRQTPCGHTFHSECLKMWLEGFHMTCPCCRASFAVKDVLDSILQSPNTHSVSILPPEAEP